MRKIFILFICFYSVLQAQTFNGTGGSIPDFPGGQQCFNLNVTGLSTNLYSNYGLTAVTVNIVHPFDADLEIVLISPNGIQTILSSNNGGAGANYTNTVFTMAAGTNIALGVAPFTGSFIPEESFYAQNVGQNGNGTWQLCITDEVGLDAGSLVNWSLTFAGGAIGSPDPGPNPVATNGCAGAPLICNLNGYTGSTYSTYTWTPANEPSGTAQPVPGPAGTFCGTIINNSSWIRFQASATSVSLGINVTNCTGSISPLGERGIQLALYNACGAPWTYSPSSLPPNNSIGPPPNDENVPSCYGDGLYGYHTLGFNNLVIGNIYYIMFDGWNGNQCDYNITVNNGVQVVSITPSANPICEGDTINLVASAPGTLNTFTWSSVPASVIPSGSSVQVHPTSSTVYTVVASGICGSQSASIPITVIPSGNPSWTAPSAICNNTSLIDLTSLITGTTGGSWTGTGVVGSDFNPAALSGNYNVTYTTGTAPCQKNQVHPISVLAAPDPDINIVGSTSICNYQTVQLTATSPVGGNYTWSTGSTATSIQVTSSGNYWVSILNANGCAEEDTLAVNITNFPQSNPVIAPSVPVICNGQSVTLSTVGSYTSYTWLPGGSGPTTTANTAGAYSVIVEDGNGCLDTASTNVIASNISVNISGDQILCAGEVSTLVASGGVLYNWNTGASTNAINVDSAGTYFASSTNNNGCTDTDTIIVSNSIFNPALTGDTIACPGDLSNLIASGGNSYVWNNSTTNANLQVPVLSTTIYSVTITNADGCSSTLSTTIHLSTDYTPPPLLLPDFDTTGYNQSITINVTINDSVNTGFFILDYPSHGTAVPGAVMILYTPDIGFSGFDTLTYVSCDPYCVNLCDTTYVIIKVNSNVLFFPEFISPNGDNSNEFWDLGDLASYPDNELTIMNRWGDALYHAQPYNNEWNGQSNMGIPSITEGVTDGTYFFVFIPYPGDEPIKGFIEIRK